MTCCSWLRVPRTMLDVEDVESVVSEVQVAVEEIYCKRLFVSNSVVYEMSIEG